MPMVQAGSVDLEYDDRGSSSVPFVLIHGYRSSHRIWDATQDDLAQRGFRSIAISMRGAAASTASEADEDYAPVNFARDVDAALEALGVTRHLLVGHSLGARTVTNYAQCHEDDQAARLAGLVLMAGGSLAMPPTMTDEQRARRQANIEGYPANINREYWEAEHVGLSAATREGLWTDWQNVPQARMRGAQSIPEDLQPTLRSMAVPTMVMFGDQDHTVPPGGSAEGYLLLPEKLRHLHVFHGIDHSPNGVIPERVGAVLTRFAHDVCGL